MAIRDIGIQRLVEGFIIELRPIFKAIANGTFPIVYREHHTVEVFNGFPNWKIFFLNVIGSDREFPDISDCPGRRSRYSDGPNAGHKITVTVMKQRRLHAYDSMRQQFAEQLFLCYLIIARQLVHTTPNTFEETFLA